MDLLSLVQTLNEQKVQKSLRIDDLEAQVAMLKADRQKKNFQIKKINNQSQNAQPIKGDSNKKQIPKSIHLEKEEVKVLEEKQQQEEALRKELEQRSTDLSNMSLKLSQKDKKINELERKLKDLNAELTVKTIN